MNFATDYEDHLRWVEQLTADVLHHAPQPGTQADHFRADLAALLCTSYVAAFECSIKAIFTSFATSKHRILGTVAGYHFKRINSKIQIDRIANEYARQFGDHYRSRFKELVQQEEARILISDKTSMKETYHNLIRWRNEFAHEGKKLATLEEVTRALPIAQIVVRQLDRAMSN